VRGRPFTIYIDEWIRSGNIGPVRPGMKTNEIKKIFPKPDSIDFMSEGIFIWSYNHLEFHLINDELQLIWCDWLDTLKSPRKKQFKLDRGILNSRTDIVGITRILKLWNKTFDQFGFYSGDQLEAIIYNFHPLTLHFEGEENQDIRNWKLIAIGSTSDNFIQTYSSPHYKKLDFDF